MSGYDPDLPEGVERPAPMEVEAETFAAMESVAQSPDATSWSPWQEDGADLPPPLNEQIAAYHERVEFLLTQVREKGGRTAAAEAERDTAVAALAALRARVEALAAEWEQVTHTPAGRIWRARAAADLRRALTEPDTESLICVHADGAEHPSDVPPDGFMAPDPDCIFADGPDRALTGEGPAGAGTDECEHCLGTGRGTVNLRCPSCGRDYLNGIDGSAAPRGAAEGPPFVATEAESADLQGALRDLHTEGSQPDPPAPENGTPR